MKTTAKLLGLLCAITGSIIAHAETGQLQGKVLTSNGKPAALVKMSIKGTGITVISSDNGNWLMGKAPAGCQTLVTSFTGLKTKESEVEVKAGLTIDMDIVLFENLGELETVVVTATRSLNERITTLGKMPVKPIDLPQSMLVIDKSVLDRQQALRLSDVLMNVNGVYIYGNTGCIPHRATPGASYFNLQVVMQLIL